MKVLHLLLGPHLVIVRGGAPGPPMALLGGGGGGAVTSSPPSWFTHLFFSSSHIIWKEQDTKQNETFLVRYIQNDITSVQGRVANAKSSLNKRVTAHYQRKIFLQENEIYKNTWESSILYA